MPQHLEEGSGINNDRYAISPGKNVSINYVCKSHSIEYTAVWNKLKSETQF